MTSQKKFSCGIACPKSFFVLSFSILSFARKGRRSCMYFCIFFFYIRQNTHAEHNVQYTAFFMHDSRSREYKTAISPSSLRAIRQKKNRFRSSVSVFATNNHTHTHTILTSFSTSEKPFSTYHVGWRPEGLSYVPPLLSTE